MNTTDHQNIPVGTVAERVAAGAAFFDEHDPDWWKADVDRAIDLDELTMPDGNNVLWQRCPASLADGEHGFDELLGTEYAGIGLQQRPDRLQVLDWGIRKGFWPIGRDEARYVAREWARVIRERRADRGITGGSR